MKSSSVKLSGGCLALCHAACEGPCHRMKVYSKPVWWCCAYHSIRLPGTGPEVCNIYYDGAWSTQLWGYHCEPPASSAWGCHCEWPAPSARGPQCLCRSSVNDIDPEYRYPTSWVSLHWGVGCVDCDRTTSEMRGLSPKIISRDSWWSENAQTHTYKHTVLYMKFKLKLLQIKCHVLEFTQDKA
jgi:hypothetical protein